MPTLRSALLLLVAARAALAACPNSTWVETPDGDCLLLLPDPPYAAVPADEALTTCQGVEEHAALPEVHEEDDQTTIQDLAAGAVVWLGLRRPDHASPFAWPSGDEVSFTAWADGQPADGEGLNCVSMGEDGAWSAELCDAIGENVICFIGGDE